MRYRNTKTGAVIDSPCPISGGDWVPFVGVREPVEIIEEPETAPVAEPAAEPEADAEINLSELTVAELKLLAKELGISLGGATRRDDILMAIMEADPVSEE